MTNADLETWSRDELEVEARRLGVIDAGSRSRYELLRAIQHRRSGPPPAPFGRARKLFGKALDFARSLRDVEVTNMEQPQGIPHQETFRRDERPTLEIKHSVPDRRERQTLQVKRVPDENFVEHDPNADKRASTSPPTKQAWQPQERPRKQRPNRATIPARGQEGVKSHPNAFAAVTDSQSGRRNEPTLHEGRPERPRRNTVAEHNGKRNPENEPIQTRTMAQLLAEQGHEERAAEIYRSILRRNPEDLALRNELNELEVSRSSQIPMPPEENDEISCHMQDGLVIVNWKISSSGMRRSKLILPDGELTLRCVLISTQANGRVLDEQQDFAVQAHGTKSLDALVSGTRIAAAVGLKDGREFVSIAHADTLTFS